MALSGLSFASRQSSHHPPSCPPSLDPVLLPRASWPAACGPMRALTAGPGTFAPRPALPGFLALASDRSVPKHEHRLRIAFAFTPNPACAVIFRLRHQSEGSPRVPTETGSSPTDRSFAFSCSPPHLAVTQLLSATESWLPPTRTCTVLLGRPPGRTDCRLRGNDVDWKSALSTRAAGQARLTRAPR